MQKYVPLVKQNVIKLEFFILGGQRIDQKRKKGWWRGKVRGPQKSTETSNRMLTKFVSIGRYSHEVRAFGTVITFYQSI